MKKCFKINRYFPWMFFQDYKKGVVNVLCEGKDNSLHSKQMKCLQFDYTLT